MLCLSFTFCCLLGYSLGYSVPNISLHRRSAKYHERVKAQDCTQVLKVLQLKEQLDISQYVLICFIEES